MTPVINLFFELKLLLVGLLMLIYFVASSQTFSKFYDLEVGFDNRSRGSILLLEDRFVLPSTHSGEDFVISSLSTYDYERGNLLSIDTLNDFVIARENSLIEVESGFNALGHRWSKDDTGARDIRVLDLDEHFQREKVKEIYYREGISVNAIGQLETYTEQIIYGNKITNDASYGTQGYIGFLDKEQDSIVNEITLRNEPGSIFTHYWISSLQPTRDGNYAYIGSRSPSNFDRGFDLVKLDRDGEILASVFGRRKFDVQPGLIQDTFGNFYFYHIDDPYFIDPEDRPSLPDSGGSVVKINADLDSVCWTLPFNPPLTTIDLQTGIYREYGPEGFLQLLDGNFLIYGRAEGLLNDIVDPGAFLAKFTPDGEILWIRVYRPELEESLQSINLNKTHIPTFLDNCVELPDGRILCSSTARYKLPDNPIHSEIWLLMLDEQGCLFPDCEELTIITSTSSTLPTQSGSIYPNPVSDILQVADVSFDSYIITDMMGRQVVKGDFDSEIHLPSSIPSGMYILQLVEDNQLKSVFKFLKQKE